MNWDAIRKEFETSDITLKALAEKHEIKLGTLKSRKSREGWERDATATPKKAATTKKDATPVKEDATNIPIREEVIEAIVESDALTDKQRLFCLYYVKTFNATQSAIKAGYASNSAHVEGSRLLRNAKISNEIKRIKQEIAHDIYVEAKDVLSKWVKIAFSDITDFLSFGRKDVEVGTDENGDPITAEVNYVDFKDSRMIDGTLISEVKQGKDGVSIKLLDKEKALEKLSQYFDLFPDNFKRQIEEEKLKLAQAKAGGNDGNTQENEIADMLRKMVDRDGT
ncbi:terminase small subunit [Priestia flexa]|uniref:terminase small subunit n=1 Tax=Priestia flexa TaxID=86664 RepID=UPI000C246872|nr:terminase small subunit [Priestia flexa]MEC0666300.1 terminase small subunit [Priestia flexa]